MPSLVSYTPIQQLARQIKTKRGVLKLSQTELAKLVGTSQATIAKLESGRGNPTLGLIQRIVTALDLNLILSVHAQKPADQSPDWLDGRAE